MTQQSSFFPLGGGMDLVTPAVALQPGVVVASLNYEPVASGYRRLRGFERYDGTPSPSDARYSVLHFTGGNIATAALCFPRKIVGAIGGAYHIVLAPPVLTGGAYEDGTATGYLVILWQLWVEFTAGETIRAEGTYEDVGVVSGPATIEEQPSGGDFAAWSLLAIEGRRSIIFPPSGTGPIRGIWFYEGHVIVARDNYEGTAGNLLESTFSSWGSLGMNYVLTFTSGGPHEIENHHPIFGASSGAMGSVFRVDLESGTWAGGDAAGRLILSQQTGTFVAEDIVRDSPDGDYAATIAGPPTLTLPPLGGRYEFVTHNFFGSSNMSRLYGVNGVGKAFDYDGLVFVEVDTGMSPDTPSHIAAHKGSLFLSFPGGSVQFSAVGNPLGFDPVLGAGEIGIGSDVTGFVEANGALAIFGENNINMLYGNDSETYQLEVLSEESGGLPHTMQRIGQIVYMDNRGLRSLAASQAYGNFSMGTLSRLVAPLLEDKRRDGIAPLASLVCRTADQYWLFFDDGTGIIANFSGKNPAILPFDLGTIVTCCCSVEDEGQERLFIGTDDGWVYELNKGTSFDGAPIEHYLRLPFNHFGSPQQRKRLHQVVIDLEAAGPATLSVSADLDYGASAGIETQELVVTTGAGAIDSLGSNELYFASQIETVAEAWLDGVALSVSLKIGGLSADEEPHTLTGTTWHLSTRGLER